jgi:HD-GYP domain-containing protein (c-di-GMP phosphodiesterase class II)
MASEKLELSVVRRIRELSRLAEANDEHTWNHTLRINLYSRLLARKLGLSGPFCDQIGLMAQMHDLGKVRIANTILAKPARLTELEYEQVKKHPVYGARLVGSDMALKMARSISLTHHERWDGSGYPYGLKGSRIPMAGRIVALADVYDALRSRRTYKPALEHDQTLKIILKGYDRTRPSHFDPEILEVFGQSHDELDSIYAKCMDRRRRPRLAA